MLGILQLNKALHVKVLKYEYIPLVKTGSDEILRKNVDGTHLHHKEIRHAKFGKIRTVRFRSSARTDIHTYIQGRSNRYGWYGHGRTTLTALTS